MTVTIYIGEWRVDQQARENVDVVSSVLDITDITKNTGDYTKTFTVPASKRNNILFKHWYDATIDNSFDARIKVAGRIEIDGFLFKKGKWRLSKVSVKKGSAANYTINFFGNLPSLKDIVKKKLLSDLVFTTLDHDYDSDTVNLGLTFGLFSRDIIYTLMPKKRYFYNDDVNDNTQLDSIANIAAGGGDNTGVIWNDLRASIKLIKIIEAIETDFDIVFSRNFFGTSEFTDLYMWLNPDADREPGGDTNVIEWDSGSSLFINVPSDTGSYPVLNDGTPSTRIRYDVFCFITPEPGFTETDYTIISEVDGEENTVTEHIGDDSQLLELNPNGEEDATRIVRWKVKSEEEFKFTARLFQRREVGIFPQTITEVDTFASVETIESRFVVSEEFPKMKIIDFLKGLFNMFKLVIVAEDDGTFYVDTLDSFYSSGGLYDVTKYIDFDSYDVERGIILNEIELKFKPSTTLLGIQFEKNNNRFYGDIEKTLEDEDGELLDGDTLTFELPFEQIVYERLTDLESGDLTRVQYAAIIDEDLEPANPKAHIFYGLFTNINSSPIAFIEDDGFRGIISGSVWTPYHHFGLTQPNYSTIFNREFSTWDGVAIENTLYKNHYDTYVSNIFNIKKRTFKYTAQLPIHIITKLKLNDAIRIKNAYYRIDKYSYNLLTGKTTFALINNFDRELNPLSTRTENIVVDFRSQTEGIVVNNSKTLTPAKIDQGDGTGWATITNIDNNVLITYDENTTELPRSMFIQYTSGSTVLNIFTQQGTKPISSDSNTITSDNDIITSDNG